MPPPSLIVHTLLTGILPAMALAAVVMAAVLVIRAPDHGVLASALGLIAGASLGWWLNESLVLISSDSAWNRLPAAALVAAWVGRLARLTDQNSGGLLRAATALAIAWFVLPANVRAETGWLAPVFAALLFAHWTILERVAADPPGGSVPFCLAIVFLVVAGVLIHANCARLMNAAIVLAAAMGGIAVVARFWDADAGGAVPAAAVMIPGLLLMGKQETFSDIPWVAFALPAAAPLLLAEALPFGHIKTDRSARRRLLWMVCLLLIPLVIALYLAHQAAPLDFSDT